MALVPDQAFGRSCYSGSGWPSLWRAGSRVSLSAAALALALSAGGCSFSYQLDSLFPKGSEPQAKTETTGSIAASQAKTGAKAPAAERDLDYAREAATEVLRRGGKGTSQPWENPETGARGTVTPIASAYSADGFTCQDFLASYVRAGSGEDWLRGEACRVHKGNWEVRSLKPWKSS